MDFMSIDIHKIVITLVVLGISVIVHEVAHGYIAYRLGDPTAKIAGRLTLNPTPHIDPVGTILFPVICLVLNFSFFFAWAKPVPVNPTYFKNPKKDDILVAIAGPGSNLILALIFTLGFAFIPASIINSYPGIELLLQTGIQWNVLLAVFNMLPIPPLDGAHVLKNSLPDEIGDKFGMLWPYGFFILIGLLYVGVLGKVMLPIMAVIYTGLNQVISILA